MPSSGVSFFRKGESIASRMYEWKARKPEIPFTTREHDASEGSRQETCPLKTPCPVATVDELCVVVGPKSWPRAFRLATYAKLCTLCIDCDSFGCCFLVIWCAFFLGIIATFVLCLCVAIGYREPYTELHDVTLRNFNLSRGFSTWELASDLVVEFAAGNPSKIGGFTTRFLHTEVDAAYRNASLGGTSVPYFAQGRKSKRNLTTEMASSNQLDADAAAALRDEMRRSGAVSGVRITVNAYTKQKYLARTLNRWFNLTCVVDVTAPSESQPGRLLRQACSLASTEPNYIGTLCALIVCIPI